ncbi:MAG: hypothetical protein HQL69_21565 [Magnetococcales bacterium]|nr:hypothetical protein [Magnetococcales bacterium]
MNKYRTTMAFLKALMDHEKFDKILWFFLAASYSGEVAEIIDALGRLFN